ncbi:GNAT family N-acetyltransferase [Pseudaestuariivita sp.]|uniref:GNAT family N-acetyltransferase n=1 Tax=Pseudaestuariivita sp. TaxID=2211669 RepID=UPI004059A0CC
MTLTLVQTDDVETCWAIRHAVFVVEQEVPADLEPDEHDKTDALHILASIDGTPIGTARVIPYGTTAKIGRVAVLASYRGQGIGAQLIHGCHHLAASTGATRTILGAQVVALSFYERLGYHRYGEVFNDAGIDHIMMERSL